MEFKKVSQDSLIFELNKPFSLSNCNDMRIAMLGTQDSALLLNTMYTYDSMDAYNFSIEYIEAPGQMPTTDFEKAIDIGAIYDKSDVLEKQTMVIDLLYTGEYAFTPIDPQINTVNWPTKSSYSESFYPVAVVSSYGACQVRIKTDKDGNKWDGVVADINSLWKAYRNPNPTVAKVSNFAEMKQYVEDNHITTCCWADHNEDPRNLKFFCSNALGTVLCFTISSDNPTALFLFETKINKINLMKHFSFSYEGNRKNILITSNIDGYVNLFEQDNETCTGMCPLWENRDFMRCHTFQIDYSQSTSRLIIVTSKGAHILAFILTPNFKIVSKTTHYVDEIAITGLQTLKPLEYIICTTTGMTKHVKVCLDAEQTRIVTTSIKNDLDSDSYQVLGLIASINRTSWIFVLYPRILCSNKSQHQAVINVCALNIVDTLDVLINNKTRSMCRIIDCAEIIRCMFLKNLAPEKYLHYNPESPQISNEFIYKLKVKLMLLAGKFVQSRKKTRHCEGAKIETDIQNVRHLILTLQACMRLSRLMNLSNLTNFQKLAGKFLRTRIVDFLKSEYTDQELYIQKVFKPIFTEILEKTENIGINVDEKCSYCDEIVNVETKLCKENHDIQRCCISQLQLELFNKRHCINCKFMALDDEDRLKEILYEGEEIRCPFCDFPLVI